MADTMSPKATQLLNDLRGRMKGRLLASQRKLTYSVAALKSIVTAHSVFHATLLVSQDLAYLSFESADITSAPGARCFALVPKPAHAGKPLVSAADMDELLGVVSAQDQSSAFRRLAALHRPASMHSSSSLGGPTKPGTPASKPGTPLSTKPGTPNTPPAIALTGQRIVVLVTDNESSAMAVALAMAVAKPQKDVVHLVNVAGNMLAESTSRALLRRHEASFATTMVPCQCDVLTKGLTPLADQIEAYVESIDAGLVILGSQVLANAGVHSTVMGSVALTLLKSISRPMLIVKANAKLAQIAWEKDKLRALVAVDHTSRPLLRYMCVKVLAPLRGDKVFLGRGRGRDASAQETVTSRRLLENFSDIAAQTHYVAVKRPLDDAFELAAVRAAELEKIHITAVQAPLGKAIPASLIQLLKATRSALLVYKSNDAF